MLACVPDFLSSDLCSFSLSRGVLPLPLFPPCLAPSAAWTFYLRSLRTGYPGSYRIFFVRSERDPVVDAADVDGLCLPPHRRLVSQSCKQDVFVSHVALPSCCCCFSVLLSLVMLVELVELVLIVLSFCLLECNTTFFLLYHLYPLLSLLLSLLLSPLLPGSCCFDMAEDSGDRHGLGGLLVLCLRFQLSPPPVLSFQH